MPHLHREIENLKKDILAVSAMAEESVQKAVRSFEDRDSALAAEVIDADSEIDDREVEVEEECLKILALHQPVAIDLRFIVAILKINNDLERIGDLAVNIAERTVFLTGRTAPRIHLDYRSMAKKTVTMLRESIDSLVNMDIALAHKVCDDDDEVDTMKSRIAEQVTQAIALSPDRAEQLIQYLLVARHLERIADLATNIAEDIIYMIKGEIVRHRLGGESGG